MSLTDSRRAASAAQAVLQAASPSLVIDGNVGRFTSSVYDGAPAAIKQQVNAIVNIMGFQDFRALAKEFSKAKMSSDPSDVYGLRIVPALIREARERGINPVLPLTQIQLESGGKSSPMGDDGKPSFNYGGLKWNSVSPRTARKATASTLENYGKGNVRINDAFAAFDSPEEFAKAYFNYLLKGPSAYRYPGLLKAKTVAEFATILKKGGYATDPDYVSKMVSIGKRVEALYLA